MVILFQDSFESGDFSVWTATGGAVIGAPVVETNNPRCGSYNMKAAIPGFNVVEALFASSSIVYARAYVKFDTLPGIGSSIALFYITDATSGYGVGARVTNTAGNITWNMNVTEPPGADTSIPGLHTPSINTYYCVEILRDVTNGIQMMWIDGALECSANVAITRNNAEIFAGSFGVGGTVGSIYADCFVVVDQRIGCEGMLNMTILGGMTLQKGNPIEP